MTEGDESFTGLPGEKSPIAWQAVAAAPATSSRSSTRAEGGA